MRRARNHHHVSLRYFDHLRLTRQPDEITPLCGGIASIKKPRYCEARCCSISRIAFLSKLLNRPAHSDGPFVIWRELVNYFR
ncbi:hypothetical protein [Providencia rettgeri]|uniref:hypothetical protein n=1 Tax=Providencia rettgeri TaxID=587 RepID=UPI0032DA36DC